MDDLSQYYHGCATLGLREYLKHPIRLLLNEAQSALGRFISFPVIDAQYVLLHPFRPDKHEIASLGRPEAST
jgi:hypothetical protein